MDDESLEPAAARDGTTDVGPRRREFDFWVGDWEVTDPEGEVVGTNIIVPVIDGFALMEQWSGRSGIRGTSISAYDRARDVWHQTWVDSGGSLLLLEGRLRGDAMVLEGAEIDDARRVTRHRISWSRVGDDRSRVRQHWESSTDNGATWTTTFDGRYARR
jgi:hypothetical protein